MISIYIYKWILGPRVRAGGKGQPVARMAGGTNYSGRCQEWLGFCLVLGCGPGLLPQGSQMRVKLGLGLDILE